jgi:hypothetical protein
MLPMTHEACLKDFFNIIISYFEMGKLNELKNGFPDYIPDSEFELFLELEKILSFFNGYSDFVRLNLFFGNILSGEIKK